MIPVGISRLKNRVPTEKTGVENQCAKPREPKAKRVQTRERHIACDHQRCQVICKPEDQRRGERTARPVPASAHCGPERDQRPGYQR